MEVIELLIAAVVVAAVLALVIRRMSRSAVERADVTAYVDEQVVHVLAQRVGRGIEDVRAVLRGGGRPDIAKRLADTRWFATVQFHKRDKDCVVRVVVSFPGARVVRERPIDWLDVPPPIRAEFMRRSSMMIDRPWQNLWRERVVAA